MNNLQNIQKLLKNKEFVALALVCCALGLYQLVQYFRYFYPGASQTTFNAMKDAENKLKLQQKKFANIKKHADVYQTMYILNFVLPLICIYLGVKHIKDMKLVLYIPFLFILT